RLRTGVFTSVDQLTEAIDLWVSQWNDDPKPFVWTKAAEEIIDKVKRGRAALDRKIKSATHH
ncbi:MAG: IS630 family transposase, partial [Microthrixaceae bacterium]